MRGIIWGKNIERARDRFEMLIEDYAWIKIKPIRVIKSRNECLVEFENGDKWKAIEASACKLGQRSNIALIDIEVDEDIVACMIKPANSMPPYNALSYFSL